MSPQGDGLGDLRYYSALKYYTSCLFIIYLLRIDKPRKLLEKLIQVTSDHFQASMTS